MELEPSGPEGESRRGQRILRLAIMVGITTAEGLIRAVTLVLEMSGMAVQGRVAGLPRPEGRVPLPELDLQQTVDIEVTGASKK